MTRLTASVLFAFVAGGCASATSDNDASQTPVTSAEARTETTASVTASASAMAAPAATTKTFDLGEHELALTIDLPSDATLKKRSGKVPAVEVEPPARAAGAPVDSVSWKTGVTLLKADAAHSTAAQWRALMTKAKGKVVREDGELLMTFRPENQLGFVLFVRGAKDTFICQNTGSTESEKDLEPLIAACRTARSK